MTREELERERDRLVKKYMAVRNLYDLGEQVPAIFVSSGYMEGFDQAVSILMPELEALKKRLGPGGVKMLEDLKRYREALKDEG